MDSITYKSKTIKIKQSQKYNQLISNKDIADVCYVYEKLIDETVILNPLILKDNIHFIYIEGQRYWTKFGIIRLAILLRNEESLDFADFIEVI